MNKTILNLAAILLVPAAPIILGGCWTPPNANVQPAGQARLIQSGITIPCEKDPATVQAVDVTARTITLKLADDATASYKVGAKVNNLDWFQPGNQVSATVTEQLAVYLLDKGRLPDGATAESLGVNAKVLLVDPSYRLLTLQYPNGQRETVKPGLDTKLLEMAPGDSVVVTPHELTKIKIEKP